MLPQQHVIPPMPKPRLKPRPPRKWECPKCGFRTAGRGIELHRAECKGKAA